MNWQAISGNPFVTVALPIVITLVWGIISQNRGFTEVGRRIDEMGKRIDDLRDSLNKRIDGVDRLLENIQTRQDKHTEQIGNLELSKWR